MRVRWWSFLFVLALCGGPAMANDEQFPGKLERVDMDTITVRCSDNRTVVLPIDRDRRKGAAPFLGKSVFVDFQQDQGRVWAIGVRSAR